MGQHHVIKYVIFPQRNLRKFTINRINKDYITITVYLQFITILDLRVRIPTGAAMSVL
jgi:hypothetical protein